MVATKPTRSTDRTPRHLRVVPPVEPVHTDIRKPHSPVSLTRVLLIEDNASDARLVREMLGESDVMPFELQHAHHLSEALERLGSSAFDAVLLDLNLPDAAGLEALAPVTEAAPDVPIIVLSGVTDEMLALSAVKHGAQDYLVKGRGDGSLLVRSIRYAIERKHAELQISYLAYHDGLTSLPNRRLLFDRLEQDVARARRNRFQLALLFLDLDHFKQINDAFGHTGGDELLSALGARLRACVRESDTVARIGGDEFALILQEIEHAEDAKFFAEKLLVALAPPFTLGDRTLSVTASIGISLYPDDGQTAETLLKNADMAMYRSKQAGRDTHSFYSRAMDSTAAELLVLSTDLRHAVDRNELHLHYQPIVDLRSGRIKAFEALLRWDHPGMGLVQPADFIPLAEERGLIDRIGRWALENACLEARRWQDAGLPSASVSVNISSHQFSEKGLLEMISRVLTQTALRPELLELELTESGIMRNPDSAIRTLKGLRSLGVRISVDDFGTGYSSLSHLKRFPLDGLKIDRSFLRNVGDPVDASIVSAIITMAHGLGLDVTAEGVEDERQLAFLHKQGCDQAQGHFFSPPLPLSALADMVGRGSHWN